MSTSTWVLFAVSVVGILWILRPLMAPETVRERDDPKSVRRELLARREMVLASLHDLEDDYHSGRLNDSDYEEMKTSLEGEAVQVLDLLAAAKA